MSQPVYQGCLVSGWSKVDDCGILFYFGVTSLCYRGGAGVAEAAMAEAVVQGSALLLEQGAASEAAAELETGLVRALAGFVLRVEFEFKYIQFKATIRLT